ncbi:MAG TPA: hypothetical protein VKG78_11260 [Opitutaceae bacterium]|nr:hypothetical protein [Opitutaceae bacterium]
MACHYIILAAAATTLEKLEKIPRAFWLKVGLAVLVLIAAVIIIRKVLKINKLILGGVAFIAGGFIWFNWIYYRNEPRFLTPFMNRIAPFFPSAGAYQTKQAGTPDLAPTPKPKR